MPHPVRAQPPRHSPAARAPTAAPTATPTPGPLANWSQALTFVGDLRGTMSQIVSGDGTPASRCTGRNSRFGGTWVSSIYGVVGREVYELLVTVPQYRGPDTYRPPEVGVQVSRLDHSALWRTSADDPVTFTVNPDEESGSIDASLTDVHDSTTGLRVTGRWSCRT